MQEKDWRQQSEAFWRARLSDEQYQVLRLGATEPAFTSCALSNKTEAGVFSCAGCEQPLFALDAKYESGSGWPSFFTPIAAERIELVEDVSHGMTRIEALCQRCGGHLGHVFPDGPKPTGLRYCINGAALTFKAT